MRTLLLVTIGVVGVAGCTASLQDCHFSTTNRARSYLASCTAPNVPWRGDFTDGWRAGYYDVATGGCGRPPAVAPRKYWATKYQSPAGQKAAQNWFAGFQAGAIAAERNGHAGWNYVPSSPVSANSAHIMPEPPLAGPAGMAMPLMSSPYVVDESRSNPRMGPAPKAEPPAEETPVPLQRVPVAPTAPADKADEAVAPNTDEAQEPVPLLPVGTAVLPGAPAYEFVDADGQPWHAPREPAGGSAELKRLPDPHPFLTLQGIERLPDPKSAPQPPPRIVRLPQASYTNWQDGTDPAASTTR